jgi:hypothetical protein
MSRWRYYVSVILVTLPTSPAWSEEVPARGSDPAVRIIIQSALDAALYDQVKHLFAIWMRDDVGQPQRASTGIRRAVTAYRHAIKAIETEKLSWDRVPR